MANDPFSLTREALYDEVWTSPITEVAKRYGLSDRGLAKLCARHDIPVPPRGWWAKKAAGHNVQQIPLPPLKEHRMAHITIEKHDPSSEPTTLTVPEVPEIAFELKPENRIIVGERLERPHAFVRRTSQALRESKVGDRGLLFPPAPSLDVRVSRAQVPRALRIMDALIKALEARGYESCLSDKETGLIANVLGEPIRVSLMEQTKKAERPPTEWERKSIANGWSTTTKFCDLAPCGNLSLRIGERTYARYELRDAAKKRVEDGLNHFVIRLVKEALQEKSWRAERERQRLEAEERQRQWAEQERLRLEEEKKIKQWDEWMSNWKRARDVKEFAAAIREACAPMEPGGKMEGWLEWAAEYAERIDPLSRTK